MLNPRWRSRHSDGDGSAVYYSLQVHLNAPFQLCYYQLGGSFCRRSVRAWSSS